MAEWKVPGLGVATVENGKTFLAKGYGWRNVDQQLPLTPDTLFAIGSNTKSFTATLLARYIDQAPSPGIDDLPRRWAPASRRLTRAQKAATTAA